MWAGSGKKYKIVDASQTRIYKILRWAVLTRQEYREMGDSQRLFITKKAWLLNGWVDGWMGGLKLNYNGGPFSKMLDGWIKIKL